MASEREWHERYLRIAKEIGTWTSCLRRQDGCVITVNRRIVATGYNGAPSGVKNCRELGYCLRESAKSGENLDTCAAVHAEMNAITQAAKMGISVNGGNIYLTTYPCATCMKLIINAGIKKVFYIDSYPSPLTAKLAEEAGVELIQMVV